MDILRKSLAPVSDEAWVEINEEAKEMFNSLLSARKFIDIEGPKGWDYAALPQGRVHVPNKQNKGIRYGMHQVQPMIETRSQFKLNVWELDNIARGAKDIDFDALDEAAKKISRFEEDVIYNGFKQGNVEGLVESSEHNPLLFPTNLEELPGIIAEAIGKFVQESVEGPYSLIVPSERWQQISAYVKGYPLKRQIEKLIEGNIILAPNIDHTLMVSERGGDFRLVLGQDISIGYESHNNKEVELYFTESFTFQVVDPAAVILIK